MLSEKIIAVMAAVLGMEASEINDSSSSENIEKWDSLRHMNLVLALEDEFGVRFPDDKVEHLTSFRLIQQNLLDALSK
jgi:acyl carrier protein